MNMKYRDLPEPDRYPGNCSQGEIEIDGGYDFSLPIVFENNYLAIIDDEVRFPGGRRGHYLRIFHQSELAGRHGTVMLARKDHLYVLLRIFRHSTRSWELECPRGFAESGLSAEENARKEIREELGVEPACVDYLGVVCPDTGMMTTRAHVYLVELNSLPVFSDASHVHEAIDSFRMFTHEELLSEIAVGSIRDSFTLSAIMIALASGRLAT